MAAPLKAIKTLRLTAKILLIATPFMVLSGFLTAKPFLIAAFDFTTYRFIHTVIAPLLFVPLLVVHSTAGIVYLLSRSKRVTSGKARTALSAAWAVGLAGLTALYLVGQPTPDPFDDLAIEDGALAAADAGDALDGSAASVDAEAEEGGDMDGGSDEPDGDADAEASGAAVPSQAKGVAKVVRPEPRKLPVKRRPVVKAAQPDAGAAAPTKSPQTDGGSRPDPAPALSGSKLVRERCGVCHPVSRVFSEKRTSAEWRTVMSKMVAMGAKLDAAERQAVLRYLIAARGASE